MERVLRVPIRNPLPFDCNLSQCLDRYLQRIRVNWIFELYFTVRRYGSGIANRNASGRYLLCKTVRQKWWPKSSRVSSAGPYIGSLHRTLWSFLVWMECQIKCSLDNAVSPTSNDLACFFVKDWVVQRVIYCMSDPMLTVAQGTSVQQSMALVQSSSFSALWATSSTPIKSLQQAQWRR